MKRLLSCLLIMALGSLLTGCFGSIKDKIPSFGSSPSTKAAVSFEIEGLIWDLDLPESWREIESQYYPPQMVIAAENGTQNFIIEQHGNYQPGIGKSLWENQDQLFHYFEGLNQDENQWQFKAQSKANTPLRTYIQKVFPIPETTHYLLGSCSAESALGENDCATIMDSWTMEAKEN